MGVSSVGTSVTLCEDREKNLVQKDKDGNVLWDKTMDSLAREAGSKISLALETGIPSQLSYGFVCGYCSGYALKKIGKAGAIVFGLGFMTLQTLSYSGYIQVDHEKLKSDLYQNLDLNEDGKVDAEDKNIALDKVMKVLQFNMPAGGGFAAGFVGGIRSG
jgi:FUN14 domain-containing protein 1